MNALRRLAEAFWAFDAPVPPPRADVRDAARTLSHARQAKRVAEMRAARLRMEQAHDYPGRP